MKKKKIISRLTVAGLCFLTVGCINSPPVMPDGNSRVLVNSPEKIDNFNTGVSEDITNNRECTALSRKYDSVLQQLARLQAEMLVLQLSAKQIPLEKAPTPSYKKSYETPSEQYSEGESMEVRKHSVLFRVSLPFNKATFKPSSALEKRLLEEASTAKRIEIRGRTDAQRSSKIDENIASKRAANVSRYLKEHNVNLDKIISSHLAAGDNIADNATSKGRAKNRRVDIEVYPETAAINK